MTNGRFITLSRLPLAEYVYVDSPIYEKSVGVHTVTRPTLRGLRIAQFSRTSNAEAHADMYTKPLVYPMKQGIPLARCYTPMDIYCCLIPD